MTAIATRLGRPGPNVPQWLVLTDKDLLPQPEKVAFPKPPKAADGSLLYERVPNKPEAERIPLNNTSPSMRRRPYDEMNGMDSKCFFMFVCFFLILKVVRITFLQNVNDHWNNF